MTVPPRIRDLIRQGAERALDPPEQWHVEMEQIMFAGPARRQIFDDPELAAAARRGIMSHLTSWILANVHAPGEPVPPNVSDEPITIARDVVRRGLDESMLDGYRVGQNLAWQHWMEIAFELTDDPAELRELLAVSAASISAYVDATVTEIAARMQAERDELTRGAQADRREVVALVLQGAPITAARVSRRLGYPVEDIHHACVVWTDSAHPDVNALDRITELLARPTRTTHAVTVAASTGTRWVWTTAAPDLDAIARARAGTDIHVTVAGPGRGLDGFRRTHLDALTTQRLLSRLDPDRRVARFDDIALVALVTDDRDAAARFVDTTLGDLARAERPLRETLRSFIRHRCNASAAAAAEYTHRNTFLRRLTRAQELLPGGVFDAPVQVGVALDIVEWNAVGDAAPASWPNIADQ